MGKKYIFLWKNLNFEHIGNAVHTTEFLALEKAVNICINYFMSKPKLATCEMKAFQVCKFTFNNDFMMNMGLNFSVTRNDLGYVLICWWVTLFWRLSYWGQVVEMNFCSINSDNLMKVLSFPASWVICNEDVLSMYYRTGIIFSE